MEKQHYVPQVYLKHFTADDGHFYSSTAKKGPYQKPKRKHPRAVCYVPDFYELKDEEDRSFIERKAFTYEHKDLSRIFKAIIRKEPSISRSNHKKLVEIYLSIKHRNKYVRELYKPDNIEKLLDDEVDKYRLYKDTLEELTDKPFDSFMGEVKEGILNDANFAERWHQQSIKDHASGMNQHVNEARRLLFGLQMMVFEPVKKSDYFVTSDNPGFTIVDRVKVFNTNYGRFDAIGFPISSRRLLLLTSKEKFHSYDVQRSIRYFPITSNYVFEFNECTTFNSLSHIFCKNSEYLDAFTKKFREKHKV